MTLYYINTGYGDYYLHSIGGTPTYYYTTNQIIAGYNEAVVPTIIDQAFGLVYTFDIPDTDTIYSANLYLDEYNYISTGKPPKTYTVQIWDSGISNYRNLTNGNLTYGASPTTRIIPFTITELNYISKTGYTLFRIICDSPGSGKAREVHIQAYENSQSTALRLDIVHSPYIPQVIVL